MLPGEGSQQAQESRGGPVRSTEEPEGELQRLRFGRGVLTKHQCGSPDTDPLLESGNSLLPDFGVLH